LFSGLRQAAAYCCEFPFVRICRAHMIGRLLAAAEISAKLLTGPAGFTPSGPEPSSLVEHCQETAYGLTVPISITQLSRWHRKPLLRTMTHTNRAAPREHWSLSLSPIRKWSGRPQINSALEVKPCETITGDPTCLGVGEMKLSWMSAAFSRDPLT
jgi:hypothetical protein